MKLIAFAGPPGSGKSEAAKVFNNPPYNCVAMGFADPLKAGLNAIFGWTMRQWQDREWKEKLQPEFGTSPRRAAQTLGTEWGRNIINANLWVKIAENKCKNILERNFHAGVVFYDLRFHNEATWIRTHSGIIIHLRRDSYKLMDNPNHSSEHGVGMDADDILFTNNGTLEEFQLKIAAFANALFRKKGVGDATF